ncbi:hypothetical protein ACO2Q8_28240 [Larkinella sp. VNQ87]|uniref:hypothetical protein n=1 Tax=Larkinella sp. VNQ87 TaxID=3400921 RepID=UPI003C087EAF
MEQLKWTYLAVLLLLLHQVSSRAQGCSDAGFCSIGGLKQQANTDSLREQWSLLLPVGLGDQAVFVFTPGIQYDRQLSTRWSIQAKLTANYARGNLGSASGLGDGFLTGIYTVPSRRRWTSSFTLGVKVPLNNGNLTSNGQALPMQYQSSLGTLDLIAGYSLNSARWQVSAGWQQPLTGANRNTFLPEIDNRPESMAYPPSNRFDRRADVLARAAYTLVNRTKVTLNAGLLGIYHLGQDAYRDAMGRSQRIAGSEGMTLNATLAGWWQLSAKTRMGFTAGLPLVVRPVRPDGLTRSIVFAPEVSWRF